MPTPELTPPPAINSLTSAYWEVATSTGVLPAIFHLLMLTATIYCVTLILRRTHLRRCLRMSFVPFVCGALLLWCGVIGTASAAAANAHPFDLYRMLVQRALPFYLGIVLSTTLAALSWLFRRKTPNDTNA